MLSRDADYAFYLYTCNRCRGCTTDRTPEMRPVCAAYAKFGFFSYSGGGKGYVSQGILEGKVKPTEETLHVAMNCLTCGACNHMCPPGFETISFIRDLRDHLVSKGLYLNAKHRRIIENVIERGNPWGMVQSSATKHHELPAVPEGAEIAIFMGCRERLKGGSLDSALKILDAAGVSYGIIPNEPCCGAPLLDLGKKSAFESIAEFNIERLNNLGVERLLTLCPHCASALTVDYANCGDLTPEVVTLPSLVNELLGEERIGFKDEELPLTATYHDPCHLGRFMDEYDQPRDALGMVPGLEIVEMDRSGKSALCCGAGGWMEGIVPELAAFAGKERIREAKSTGAEAIITACSYCTEYMRRMAGKSAQIINFADLIADRLK